MTEANTNTRFVNEIKRSDRLISQIIDRLVREFEAYISEQYDLFSEGENRDDIVLAELRSEILPENLQEALDDILEIYTSELANLKGRFAITEEDIQITDQIGLSEIALASSIIVEAKQKLSSSLALAGRSSNGRSNLSRAAALAQNIDPAWSRIETNLVTNAAGYRSALEIQKAVEITEQKKKEPISTPLFEYIGAVDDKNRPFCRHVLTRQRFYSLDEIKELDKDPRVQLLPVFIYGGGYNCRHRWIFTARR